MPLIAPRSRGSFLLGTCLLGAGLVMGGVMATALGAQPAWAEPQHYHPPHMAAPRHAGNPGGGARPKGQPNARAMEGLPPKWVDKLRDATPEQQERFMENNDQF